MSRVVSSTRARVPTAAVSSAAGADPHLKSVVVTNQGDAKALWEVTLHTEGTPTDVWNAVAEAGNAGVKLPTSSRRSCLAV